MKRSGPLKRKTWMRRVSAKRRIQKDTYSKLNKAFLALPANKYCPVMFKLYGMKFRAREVHHIDGREGELLNDTSKWLAVSRPGHNFIHQNSNKAREHGWLV